MTGGYIVVGPCYSCGAIFTFNPERVPSVPIDPLTRLPLDVDERGERREIDPDARDRARREPICEDCLDLMNRARAGRGEPPVVPLPGAYDYVEGLPG